MNTQADYQLANAEPEDLPAVKDILENSQLPSDDITIKHLQHYFLVKSDTKVIGTVGLEVYDDYALLRSLAVRKNQRGSGLGKLLVQQIESYAGDLGISEIYLLTTTADQFFRYLGYDEVSRTAVPDPVLESEEFSKICPSTAVSMKKTLCRCG